MTISAEFCDVFPTSSRLAQPKSFFYLCRCLEKAPADVGTLNPPCKKYMAIINSMGVGKARGSMGNVTYRTVRGRTIGSQKRGGVDPSTRVDGQTRYQFIFGLIARFVAAHAEDIKVSFADTKYGSARNMFIKLNYAAFFEALGGLFIQGVTNADAISDQEIETAVAEFAAANPTTIYRVKRDGETVYLTGAWNSEDNPEAVGGVLSLSAYKLDGKSLSDGASITVAGDATSYSFGATVNAQEILSLEAGTVQVKIGESVLNGSDVVLSGSALTANLPALQSIPQGAVTITVTTIFNADGKERRIIKTFSNVTITAQAGSNPL